MFIFEKFPESSTSFSQCNVQTLVISGGVNFCPSRFSIFTASSPIPNYQFHDRIIVLIRNDQRENKRT